MTAILKDMTQRELLVAIYGQQGEFARRMELAEKENGVLHGRITEVSEHVGEVQNECSTSIGNLRAATTESIGEIRAEVNGVVGRAFRWVVLSATVGGGVGAVILWITKAIT